MGMGMGVATGHASTPDSGGEDDGEGQETVHKGKQHRQGHEDVEEGEVGEGEKATPQSNWTTDTENNGEDDSDDDPFTTPPTREGKGLFGSGSGSGSGAGKGGQAQVEGEGEGEGA